jgi:broad-specificity NMP kinase
VGQLIVLIGASGSGKTAVAELLEQRSPWTGHTHYFDSIGVPSVEEMESYGGGEAWQRRASEEWVRRIARLRSPLELLEGQTRPSFLQPELMNHPDLEPTIILLDCNPSVRRHRLVELRKQGELDNSTMENWAAYLRGQADALGLPVIDTSDLTLEGVAAAVEIAAGIPNVSEDAL